MSYARLLKIDTPSLWVEVIKWKEHPGIDIEITAGKFRFEFMSMNWIITQMPYTRAYAAESGWCFHIDLLYWHYFLRVPYPATKN